MFVLDSPLKRSLVGLVASDCGRWEATNTNPTIRKLKAEEALRVPKRLRRSDSVTEVLDHVEHLGLLAGPHSFHLAFEQLNTFFGSIDLGLIGLAEKELTLAIRRLVEIDQCDKNWKPDSSEPALARPPRHLLQVKPGQELDLDQHGQVVEQPVEGEE